MRLVIISDLHNKYGQLYHPWYDINHLGMGDILINAGDFSSKGTAQEIEEFLKWFSSVPGFKYKITIAGNHDFGFEKFNSLAMKMVSEYPDIIYLQESGVEIDGIKIWGSPWTPRFHNWAFNADRGEGIKEKWDAIPESTDILITHGPAHGVNDVVEYRVEQLGCVDLMQAIQRVQPKIFVCGHIHTGNGITFHDNVHHINASVLDERYDYAFRPKILEWFPETNELIDLTLSSHPSVNTDI